MPATRFDRLALIRTDDAVAVAPAAPTMIVYSPRGYRVRVALQVTF